MTDDEIKGEEGEVARIQKRYAVLVDKVEGKNPP
jgi:hypothetical protein